jgi:hypothetical protein
LRRKPFNAIRMTNAIARVDGRFDLDGLRTQISRRRSGLRTAKMVRLMSFPGERAGSKPQPLKNDSARMLRAQRLEKNALTNTTEG